MKDNEKYQSCNVHSVVYIHAAVEKSIKFVKNLHEVT